ncbi:MAG: DNA-processing protein DprA [Enterobacterales bacterium]|nr:DNA-processing protein DprA [Enterobacterales bacterium]
MDENEIRYWFALKSIMGVGDAGAHKLLNHFKSPQKLFNATTDQLKSLKLKPQIQQSIQNMDFDQFDPLLEWLDRPRHHCITLGSSFYPPLLAETTLAPILLFAIGNIEQILNPQIAVVGSRTPTHLGLSNTKYFCQSLVASGLSITSGLAFGIDAEAHRTALDEKGYTIAVMGTGLNLVYPAAHRQLAHSISEQGLLLSECFPDERGSAASFPRRNRIIAGLSLGTLVVEAALKSGSLITARIAMDEGREVFAVPGNINNTLAQGCHSLIKQGAKLVETSDDMLDELPALATAHKMASSETRPQLNQDTAEFLKSIDFETTSLDTILERSQLPIETITNKLLLLELDGWVINAAGGYSRI